MAYTEGGDVLEANASAAAAGPEKVVDEKDAIEDEPLGQMCNQTPAELKQLGNGAYANGDVTSAVDFWNQALKLHVASMRPGKPLTTVSPWSDESRLLEKSLYLNLAQGHLRLEQPEKALRACYVVMHEHPDDLKAKYRAAEACLSLRRFDEAVKRLCEIRDAPDCEPNTTAGVQRLLQRAQAGQRQEVQRQRAVAKKMCAAASVFSEDRPPPRTKPLGGSDSRAAACIAEMDPKALESGLEIGDAVAKAAIIRNERIAAGPSPPVPKVHDADKFLERTLGKSRAYAARADKYRRKRNDAEHGVKLAWLRGGRSGHDFRCFADQWRSELEQEQAYAPITVDFDSDEMAEQLGQAEELERFPNDECQAEQLGQMSTETTFDLTPAASQLSASNAALATMD